MCGQGRRFSISQGSACLLLGAPCHRFATSAENVGNPAHRPCMPGRKLAEQESRAREVRLARALEEVERHKVLLQDAKAQVGVLFALRVTPVPSPLRTMRLRSASALAL